MLEQLTTLDVRDNPITQGFYAPVTGKTSMARGTERQLVQSSALAGRGCESTSGEKRDADEEAQRIARLAHLLPLAVAGADAGHVACLDEGTKLKRRVYELLLAHQCARIEVVDGLVFDRARIGIRDADWVRLRELGFLRRSEG